MVLRWDTITNIFNFYKRIFIEFENLTVLLRINVRTENFLKFLLFVCQHAINIYVHIN